ncbi:MAG: hypothetical protein L0H84_02035, partial [Pseudonocardia sp.]|nr:hypothetical protein [Pseudonocardia sp.]
LAHLRRQVRTEELIRERRAARMAGTRRHDRAAAGPTIAQPDAEPAGADDPEAPTDDVDGLQREEPERVTGTGAPVPRILTSLDELTVESALPRLEPAPPPPLPAGTVLVEELADDLDADLDAGQCTDYRRAAGA